MTTEFETLLSRTLHEATPEPPAEIRPEDVISARHGHRIPRILAPALAAAAVVVVGIAVALQRGGVHGGDDRRSTGSVDPLTAPSSITVAGRSVPYAGEVPWSDTVADPDDPRTLTVYADGDDVQGKFVCGLPEERVHVAETATTVTVLVAGYGTPLPKGVPCSGVGHSAQPIKVVLKAPLGTRKLVDATTKQFHTVLNPASVPAVTRVPAGMHEQPPTWDESTGTVVRMYVDTSVFDVHSRYLVLTIGSPAAISELGVSGAPLGTVDVNGHEAGVHHDAEQRDYTVTWSIDADTAAQLLISYPSTIPLTEAAALDIARSVR